MAKEKGKKHRDEIPAHFRSAEEAAEFWDTHDQTDYEDVSKPVEFAVDIKSEETVVSLDPEVSRGLEAEARRRHVSPETLANLWIRERLVKF
jgi:hypothetical protein